MKIQKSFTVREMRKILTSNGYKMVSSNSDHEKWKRANSLDVVIPNGHKDLNRMLGRRLYKQIVNKEV